MSQWQRRYLCVVFAMLCLVLLLVMDQYRQLLVKNALNSSPMIANHHSGGFITEILQLQRLEIAKEFNKMDYETKASLNDWLASLIPEMRGSPKRCIIVSTWSTGATFLAELLNSNDVSFYHFEPLQRVGIRRIRENETDFSEHMKELTNLLNCKYPEVKEYLAYAARHPQVLERNRRLDTACDINSELCRKADFLQSFCKLFPVQVMKLVRLRLDLARQLLEQPELNVRMLYMVRDPRGIMWSRSQHTSWCAPHPDCADRKLLCRNLLAEHETAEQLQMKFPTRFRTLRFEDFAVNVPEKAREIFKFFELPFSAKVKLYIKSHTQRNIGGITSTFRDSKMVPFKWRHMLPPGNLTGIEADCEEAMEMWGYSKTPDYMSRRTLLY